MAFTLISRAIRRIKRCIFPDIYKRLDEIEYRSFNRRFYAIEQCAEYLVGAQLEGDYLEFGVYKGDTFSHAFKWMSPLFSDMRFWAFDSFEGLPGPSGRDVLDGYSSHFYKTQFACSQEQFLANVKAKGVDPARTIAVKGWFNETLAPENERLSDLKRVSVAWIDCDLYESTVPVLKFITPFLSAGSVIIFDDWRCYRNHPDFGEQRACKEWLEANRQISLAELYSFGWNGKAFTVVSCPSEDS